MKADEAKQIAFDFNTKSVEGQLSTILKDIKAMAEMGKYMVYFYQSLLPDVRVKLRELEYDISESSHRNETTVTIEWK